MPNQGEVMLIKDFEEEEGGRRKGEKERGRNRGSKEGRRNLGRKRLHYKRTILLIWFFFRVRRLSITGPGTALRERYKGHWSRKRILVSRKIKPRAVIQGSLDVEGSCEVEHIEEKHIVFPDHSLPACVTSCFHYGVHMRKLCWLVGLFGTPEVKVLRKTNLDLMVVSPYSWCSSRVDRKLEQGSAYFPIEAGIEA